MEDIVELINLWSEERGLATNTQRAYALEVERFAYWISCIRGMSIYSCTSQHIVEYFDVLQLDPSNQHSQFHIRRRKALSPSSVEQTRRILKAFYEWGVRTRRLATNPLWDLRPQVSQQELSNTLVKQPEIDPIVSRSATLDMSEGALRLASIIHLGFWVGASAAEIAELTVNDLELNEGGAYLSLPLRHSPSKTKVELPPQVAETLQNYLGKRYGEKLASLTGEEPLISSLDGAFAVTGWAIWRTVHAWQDSQRPMDVSTPKGLRALRRSFIEIASSVGIQETVVARHLRRKRLSLSQVNALAENVRQGLYDSVARKITNNGRAKRQPTLP